MLHRKGRKGEGDEASPSYRSLEAWYLKQGKEAMNIQDIQYHGIREQCSRILKLMTNDEIDNGLTAFEDGASSWASCWFARALPYLYLDEGQAERKLMEHFKLGTAIPIRMMYCTFDGAGVQMTKDALRQFIEAIRDERRPAEVNEILRNIDFSGVEDREIVHTGPTCQ